MGLKSATSHKRTNQILLLPGVSLAVLVVLLADSLRCSFTVSGFAKILALGPRLFVGAAKGSRVRSCTDWEDLSAVRGSVTSCARHTTR